MFFKSCFLKVFRFILYFSNLDTIKLRVPFIVKYYGIRDFFHFYDSLPAVAGLQPKGACQTKSGKSREL